MIKYCILGPDDPALQALEHTLTAHPEWETALEILPWASYQPALDAALHAEISPYQAVCVPGHVWLPGLVNSGLLSAIDPLKDTLPESVIAAYNAEEILPGVVAEAKIGSLTYLLPVFTDGHLLFFNKDFVDLPDGATVSPLSLANLASAMNLPEGISPLALKAHPSEILLDWLPFLWEAGGEVLDAAGVPRFAGVEGVEALEYYCALKRYCPPQVESYGNAEIAEALRCGKTAMAASWGGQAAVIFDGPANLGTALYPHPWNATWGICLPANQPEEQKRAMLERLYRSCGSELDHEVTRIAGSPVWNSSYKAADCARYPWLMAQHEMLRRARNLPVDPHLSAFLGDLYAAVYTVFIGQQPAAQALKMVERKALKALE